VIRHSHPTLIQTYNTTGDGIPTVLSRARVVLPRIASHVGRQHILLDELLEPILRSSAARQAELQLLRTRGCCQRSVESILLYVVPYRWYPQTNKHDISVVVEKTE